MMKTIKELIQNIANLQIIGDTDKPIGNIQFDSRKVQAGDLFVATRGTVSDGHDFIPMAIEKGATAVIIENEELRIENDVTVVVVENSLEALGKVAANWFDNPSEKLTLTGVTGTNGKTTIATLLYEMFRKLGHKTGLLSTVCNYIDGKAIEATHTTPDPIELNSLLAQMVAAGCEYAFMEVSSHAIDQRRIAGLRFAGGIFTNLTQDHLDYHKTMQEYLRTKKRFFDELPAGAFALTNLDDKNGMVMLQNTRAKKYTYSIRSIADFKTKIIEHSFEGMLLEMNGREVYVPFMGKFNASNLTAVFGAAMLLSPPAPQRGESLTAEGCNVNRQAFPPLGGGGALADEILTIISALHSVSGRFEAIRADKGFTAIVDYAHTPDALENVIGAINQVLQGAGSLITVCGCGGDRDKTKRPLMARAAFDNSNRVIFTSDNPRSEDPQAILGDMLAGLSPVEQNKVLTIVDRKEAIKTACALAQKGDVILIAGKGHEDYQIIKGVKQHFDDREVVKEFI